MLVNYVHQKFKEASALNVSQSLLNVFKRRRTIREFSPQKMNRQIVLNAIEMAGLAPSGANKQPWSFCLIENQELKKSIKTLAEKEEYDFYHKKKNENWINDLKHLHTNDEKKFLVDAPYLIAIFHRHFDVVDGEKKVNYYAKESVGISTGFLISALHMAGLSVLTYTPSKMQFLGKLLERPAEERTFMLLAVGLPSDDAEVPMITKKALDQIVETYS